MAAGDVWGSVPCGCCGEAGAKVTETKSGGATVYCRSCGSQLFVRNPRAVAQLRGRIEPEPAPAPAGKRKPAQAPAQAARAGGWLENL